MIIAHFLIFLISNVWFSMGHIGIFYLEYEQGNKQAKMMRNFEEGSRLVHAIMG